MPPIMPRPQEAPGVLAPVKPAVSGAVLGFYGFEGTELALEKSGFNSQAEMEEILTLVKDADPSIRLGALKHFRKVLKEIAIAQGMFAKQNKTTVSVEDGKAVKHVESTIRLLQMLKQENERERDPDLASIHQSFPPRELVSDSPSIEDGERDVQEGQAPQPSPDGGTGDH